MLCFISYITSSFSPADSIYVLCTTLEQPKFEYPSDAWSSFTSTERPNLKEFKENLLPSNIPDVLWVYIAKIMKQCDIISGYTVGSLLKNTRWIYLTSLQLIISGLMSVASQITVLIIIEIVGIYIYVFLRL
jgi:hypothetical protein